MASQWMLSAWSTAITLLELGVDFVILTAVDVYFFAFPLIPEVKFMLTQNAH